MEKMEKAVRVTISFLLCQQGKNAKNAK